MMDVNIGKEDVDTFLAMVDKGSYDAEFSFDPAACLAAGGNLYVERRKMAKAILRQEVEKRLGKF